MNAAAGLPAALLRACRRWHVAPTSHVLVASVARQELDWWQAQTGYDSRYATPRTWHLYRRVRASTSRFGIGQVRDSQRTPLGLHRIAQKVGDGWPVGTVFQARRPTGYVWDGMPNATIAHRILWLEGLEPGFNRGGEVDTRGRFIYIHGLADEPTLGRPASHGCIHLAAADLVPLFDQVPVGSLVWITASR